MGTDRDISLCLIIKKKILLLKRVCLVAFGITFNLFIHPCDEINLYESYELLASSKAKNKD